MAPKKVTAAKFLVRAHGQGTWTSTGEDAREGEFRVSVNTDLAEVNIFIGPDYLEDWNPAPLCSYSFRYLRGGSHLRIVFELAKPTGCQGELEMNVFGGLAGKLKGLPGPGKVTGVGTVEEARDHIHELPRPTKMLAEKLQNEPTAVRWEVPDSVCKGRAMLVGVCGPSKSGKSTLAKALADSLCKAGRQVAIVEQSRYERCIGSYHCSAGVEESMYDNPSAVNWAELVKATTAAADRVSAAEGDQSPGIVLIEGSLVFWIPQINQALAKRIFLRTSRAEVLRRRQASQVLAEPFVEHVFWPMHLQYGQPQAIWEDIRIDDDSDGYPVPETILSDALAILQINPPSERSAPQNMALPRESSANRDVEETGAETSAEHHTVESDQA